MPRVPRIATDVGRCGPSALSALFRCHTPTIPASGPEAPASEGPRPRSPGQSPHVSGPCSPVTNPCKPPAAFVGTRSDSLQRGAAHTLAMGRPLGGVLLLLRAEPLLYPRRFWGCSMVIREQPPEFGGCVLESRFAGGWRITDVCWRPANAFDFFLTDELGAPACSTSATPWSPPPPPVRRARPRLEKRTKLPGWAV